MPARAPASPALAHIVAAADFERVLRERSRAATAQFSVHHLDAEPRPMPPTGAAPAKLSTSSEPASEYPVEDSSPEASRRPLRIGAVVPKRHARRAVTRSLVRREIYAAAERHRDHLAAGLWIVRLRAPIDRSRFPSAASTALRRAVRAELDQLLAAAAVAPRR